MKVPSAASWAARSLEAAQPNTPPEEGIASSAARATAAAIIAVRPASCSNRRVRACARVGVGGSVCDCIKWVEFIMLN